MLSGLLKIILGVSLAFSILIGSGVAAALYFMNRTSVAAPKPIYPNDSPAVRAKAAAEAKASPTPTPVDSEAKAQAEATPTPTPTPKETPEVVQEEPLPDGAYNARVTWQKGLSLRAEPTQNANRVGGVGFNEKIIVLEVSPDNVWQKIRVEGSKQEGWVKAGNTRKTDGEDDSQPAEQNQ